MKQQLLLLYGSFCLAQDRNWPIFLSIRELLQQHPGLVVGPVREVLKGDDDDWKNHCL
jgi:hypothetical protein